jgi:DNA-3-methyladenine glycosylase II
MTAAAPDSPEVDEAYDRLTDLAPELAALVEAHGRPNPFSWQVLQDAAGNDPLAELALHVVSQQISTTAALTIYARLLTAVGGRIEAARLLAADPVDLRAAGLSGAKVSSLLDLAQRVVDGRLDFTRLAHSDDLTAQAELQQVRGVGPWTAQMFLLHRLRRPDVFPAADLGLLHGAQVAFGLSVRPTPDELAERAERWRPLRSYAAALLWTCASTQVSSRR